MEYLREAWSLVLENRGTLLMIPWFFIQAFIFGALGYRIAKRKRPYWMFFIVFSFLGITLGHYLYNFCRLHDILTDYTGSWLIFPIINFDLDWGWPWMRWTARAISIPWSIIGIAIVAKVLGWFEDKKKFTHMLEEM